MCQNIQDGKFDFRRGNTLAMFAEAMVQNLEINVSDTQTSDNAPINFMNGSKQQLKLKVGGMGTNNINYIYSYLVEITSRLIPFYQYYF